MSKPLPHAIERAARPFLPQLLKLAAEAGRFPGDYFLVLGKYDPTGGVIATRAGAAEFLDLAKSEARRRKYERLLASPCDRHDLLILMCAGDHVEGHWMRVPAVVPPQKDASPGATTSGHAMTADVESYLRVHMGGIVKALRQKKERLGDWYALLRTPHEVPVVLRRRFAKSTFASLPVDLGLDWTEVLRAMESSTDDEVFCINPVKGELLWYRVPTSLPVSGDETLAQLSTRLLDEGTAALRAAGQNPADYLAYVRWSAGEGGQGGQEKQKSVQPLVFPRVKVEEELRELHGTKKYAQILQNLADPYDGLMLFVDDPASEDIGFAAKDEDFGRQLQEMAAEAVERLGLR